MKPAPMRPTRTGRPSASRSRSAFSTMIISCLSRADAHTGFEFGLHLIQRLPFAILVRHGGDWQEASKAQTRVGVQETAFGCRCIEFPDVVSRFGIVLEGLIPMGEPLWYVNPSVVLGAEFDCDVLKK